MGLVILDLTFRVEKKFKITLPKDWHQRLGMSWDNHKDATLGQFHDLVLQLCTEQNVPLPADSWATIVRLVSDVSGIHRKKITRETKLIKDIAPYA